MSISMPAIGERFTIRNSNVLSEVMEARVDAQLDEETYSLKVFDYGRFIYKLSNATRDAVVVPDNNPGGLIFKIDRQDQDRRCCNVHCEFLVPSNSMRTKQGSVLLACPELGCTVGVWSTARASTPADQATRRVRAEVFAKLKDSPLAMRERIMAELNNVQESIGALSFDECVEILRSAERPIAVHSIPRPLEAARAANVPNIYQVPDIYERLRAAYTSPVDWAGLAAGPALSKPTRKHAPPEKPKSQFPIICNNTREIDLD